MRKLFNLNQTGSFHLIIPALMVMFAIIGTYFLVSSHAATTTVVAVTPTISNPDTQGAIAVSQLHSWFNANTYNSTGWWESASAVGNTVDYMQQTGSRAFVGDVQNFYNAHSSTNFIINSYYDDEGWWALTWIKAYKLTGNTAYLNTAKAIFNNMTGGWDGTCSGGLWWTTAKTYKNAIPNELFLNIAAQLHSLTPGDSNYENWATKEWTWFQNSGMLTSSNLVVDGLSSSCQPLTNPANTWTYNQGELIGGLVNLYKITGGSSLLTTAQNVATAVTTSTTLSPNGILTEPCEPAGTCNEDRTIFKGVFAQNLKLLYNQTNNASYQTYLQQNTNSVWKNDRSINEFGLHWAGPFDSADAGRQTAAVALFNTQVQPRVNLMPSGSVTLFSGMTGFCLDDKGNSSATNAIVDLYSCNGTAAQHWTIAGDGTIRINGKCLDLYQANTGNGGKADLYICNGGKTQQWQVRSDATILNVTSGKCLDDPGFATANGTQLDLYTCNGGNNQLWYLPS